jgi:hypothetical protein
MDEKYIIIAVAVVIVIAIALLIFNNRKDVLAKAALEAVARAQQAWGSDTGKLKFAEVYAYLKTHYPVVTFFLSEKKLADIIERALAELKELIASKVQKLESENKDEEVSENVLMSSILKQIADDKTRGK